MSRRGLIAMIHVARKDLGLDEDTYRATLKRVTGKTSSADLNETQLGRVIDDFKQRGWKPKRKTRASHTPHVRKVWALWKEMCDRKLVRSPDRAALRAFVLKMTNVADPEWLTPAQTNQVIEALKAWKARALAQGAPAAETESE